LFPCTLCRHGEHRGIPSFPTRRSSDLQRPKGSSKDQLEILYQDEHHVAYHATRGCMLYVTREVVQDVGGLDPEFGQWGWEHVSWSDRIHNRGWTTWRYADA